MASEMPLNVTAGSQIRNTVFEVVNSEGEVDASFHDEEKSGQSHTLLLKSDIFSSEDCTRYTFINGWCIIPIIPVPESAGNFTVTAAHSRIPELQTELNISVVQSPKVKYDAFQSPFSVGKMLQLQESKLLEESVFSESQDDSGELALAYVNRGKS